MLGTIVEKSQSRTFPGQLSKISDPKRLGHPKVKVISFINRLSLTSGTSHYPRLCVPMYT